MKNLLMAQTTFFIVIFLILLTENVSAETREGVMREPASVTDTIKAIFHKARIQEPTRTPDWVNAIPDRIADILIEKHLYKNGKIWGLAKGNPSMELDYEETGSSTFHNLVKQYNLYDRVGALTDEKRREAIAFWQSWQDPKTGRFIDPRDPARAVNEKYVAGLIHALGGELLYKWTTTSQEQRIDTKPFLERTKEDPDWARGGWSVGSHTGFMAVEIFEAINQGQTELIPDLEKGLEQMMTHQDPASGMWGPPEAELWRRLGGNLKVIGRLYFKMGLKVPHTKELADTLIENQRNRNWTIQGEDSCVPRNLAEVTAYCLEASDYRRDELLWVLRQLAEDYRAWVAPDGSLLIKRGDHNSVGIQYTTLYGLGAVGGYLHWEDCRLNNPLENNKRGQGFRYQMRWVDGKVKVVDTEK